MSIKLKLFIGAAIVCASLLSGCATSRSIIDVPLPTSELIAKPNGKEIYINSVIDKRLFEIKPAEPSTPSLDPDEEQGDKIRLRAIGRKRNGYGKGLGDILLPEGKTVESLIDAALRQAFVEDGYKVISRKEQITDDTYVVDAQINKLWSWMNPGFWAITLSTEISTNIEIKNKNAIAEKTLSIKNSDTFQAGTESNWLEVIQNALKAYIIESNSKLKSVSL